MAGESLPVVDGTVVLSEETGLADRINMAHTGTVVSQGLARAVHGPRSRVGRDHSRDLRRAWCSFRH